MTAYEVASRFNNVRVCRGRESFKASCPCHNDKAPSLSISAGKRGGVVLHCFAGCKTADIMSAAGLSWADIMPERS